MNKPTQIPSLPGGRVRMVDDAAWDGIDPPPVHYGAVGTIEGVVWGTGPGGTCRPVSVTVSWPNGFISNHVPEQLEPTENYQHD